MSQNYSTSFDTDKIKISGAYLDQGAFDRAVMVARDLHERGQWDGVSEIVIHDPYHAYSELSRRESATMTDNALTVPPTDERALTLPPDTPLDKNPAAVYIASLAAGSRPTMIGALNTIAALLGVPAQYTEREDRRRARPGEPIVEDATWLTVAWHNLRYQHAAFIRSQLAAQYSAGTANKMLSALRQVLYHAWKLELMSAEDYQRARDIKPVKGGNEEPAGRALGAGEIAALSAACQRDTSAAGVRDAAIVGLLWANGLRRASIPKLALDDYDRDTSKLVIRKAKGGKTYSTFVTNGTRDALEDWLALRGDSPGPLFLPVSQTGEIEYREEPMTPQSVFALLMKRAEQAGVSNFSPHDLRRTFAGDLLDAGADIVTVQKLMGHASVTTTARYDRRPEEAKRKAAELLHFPYKRRSRLIDHAAPARDNDKDVS